MSTATSVASYGGGDAACMFEPFDSSSNNEDTTGGPKPRRGVTTVVSSATSTTDDYHPSSTDWMVGGCVAGAGADNPMGPFEVHRNGHRAVAAENRPHAAVVAHPAPSSKKRSLRRSAAACIASSKSVYKHVPHKDKPPHLVARRNARERRRVQAVNSAFARLRRCVPVENRSKRLSKVKTLHKAIEYISNLQQMLDEADAQIQVNAIEYSHADAVRCKKENGDAHHLQSWTTSVDMPSCRQEDFDAFTSFYEGYVDYQN